MSHDELQQRQRGNRPDYVLGTVLDGWAGFEVVRWSAFEALSTPFEIQITLMRRRDQGPADLDALLDTAASLRIATEGRWRVIHGIIIEAEELERTSTLYLYRVVLAPPIWRAKHRSRSRTFVDQSLEQILVALLENRSVEHPTGFGGLLPRARRVEPAPIDPSFATFDAPVGLYRIAVSDPSRLKDATLRSYVVQYNESDFDFMSRLLEEEGLTYCFEHTADGIVMTITDRPGHVSLFDRDAKVPFRGAVKGVGARDREVVRTLKTSRRFQRGCVGMRDWDPKRPLSPQEATAMDDVPSGHGQSRSIDPALYLFNQFPARDEAVRAQPCVAPANYRLERMIVERTCREGTSTCRIFEAGLRFRLVDDSGLRPEEQLIVVSIRTFATQLSPQDTLLDEEPFGLQGRGHDGAVYENAFEVIAADVVYRPAMKTPRPRIDGVHAAVVSADEVVGAVPEIHRNAEGSVRVRFPWDERIESGVPASTWIRVSQGWGGAGYGHLFTPRVGQEVLVAYLQGDPDRPVIVGRVHNAVQPVPYEKPTVSTIKTKSSPGSDGFNELRFDDEAGAEEVYLRAERDYRAETLRNSDTSVGVDESRKVGGSSKTSVKGGYSLGSGSTHINTGPYEVRCKDGSIDAKGDIALRAGDERKDVSANHNISTGGLWVRATAATQIVTGTFTVMAPDIVLTTGGGASIELHGGNILIKGGVVEVVGAPIKLNC